MPRNESPSPANPPSQPLDGGDKEDRAAEAVAPLTLAAEIEELTLPERQVLQCLGAAVVTLWNELPRDLQRDVFAAASAESEGPFAADLRSRLARFLHDHKGDRPAGRDL